MEQFNKRAIHNLEFLQCIDKFQKNQYKLVSNEFVNVDDESFDTVYSFKELEYPLYFTFHQIINTVHGSYSNNFHGHSRNKLLTMMDTAINNLNKYYLNIETEDEEFEYLLDAIDESIFVVSGYYKYGWCYLLPTKVKEYVNTYIKKAIIISHDIVHDYMDEILDPGRYNSESESDTDTDTETDKDDKELLEGKETNIDLKKVD
jgi:hypothetical protein